MSENKTKPTGVSVDEFIDSIDSEKKKQDSVKLLELMKNVTNLEPVMWGTSIVGFGSYHYVYDSGREGDWFTVGFSPRKNALTVYVRPNLDSYTDELLVLGKFRKGRGCLYINKLEDVDLDKLGDIIEKSSK